MSLFTNIYSKQSKPWQHKAAAALFVPLMTLFWAVELSAAPYRNNYSSQNESAIAVKELRDSYDDIRHEVNNHETEIRMFDEKLTNFYLIIESVRDQFSESARVQKEQLKGNATDFESKLSELGVTAKGIVADMRQFKAHANDVTTNLAQCKQKIIELEKQAEMQDQNIEHLQAAMKALMDVLQIKDKVPAVTLSEASKNGSPEKMKPEAISENTYCIKPGDSLEKIARHNQTTVKVLKELNGLTTDRIVVGKVLKLPESQ